MHADPGGGGGFTVEIPGAGEVVEGVFQGELVIGTVEAVSGREKSGGYVYAS